MSGTLAIAGLTATGFHEGPVALAARRLSIIDLAPGHQPILNEDGPSPSSSTARSTTSASCGASSRRPGTASARRRDTEVLLHGYRAWGLALLDRLRGMLPSRSTTPSAARRCSSAIRLGIKPLYVARRRAPARVRLRGAGAAPRGRRSAASIRRASQASLPGARSRRRAPSTAGSGRCRRRRGCASAQASSRGPSATGASRTSSAVRGPCLPTRRPRRCARRCSIPFDITWWPTCRSAPSSPAGSIPRRWWD